MNKDPYPRPRKLPDRSIALLLVGAALILPPIGAVSLIEGSIMGLPIPVFYIFAVWTGLIIGAAALSRQLITQQDEADANSSADSQ